MSGRQTELPTHSQPGCIAITGLASWLGTRLAERLLAIPNGPRLVGLDVRRPQRLEGQLAFHRVDLTEPTADGRVAEILEKEGVDAFVHLAFRSAPTPDVELDHELETVGSLHVMNACSAAAVRRFVLSSSTMLYGARPDNPNFLDETRPLRGHPDAHCIANRVEAEALLADWGRAHPECEVTVLRPCWIAGPGFVDASVRYFDRSVVPVMLGYDPLMQLVHESDVLRCFERAVLGSHPGTYNIVGRGVLPLSTLLALAGKRALRLPATVLYRLAATPSKGQTGDGPAGFFDYLRYLWVADGERGWQAFGEPDYSTQEAWASFVSARRMRAYV